MKLVAIGAVLHADVHRPDFAAIEIGRQRVGGPVHAEDVVVLIQIRGFNQLGAIDAPVIRIASLVLPVCSRADPAVL